MKSVTINAVAILLGVALAYVCYTLFGGRYYYFDREAVPQARFDHLTGTLRYWGRVDLATYKTVHHELAWWKSVTSDDEILVQVADNRPVLVLYEDDGQESVGSAIKSMSNERAGPLIKSLSKFSVNHDSTKGQDEYTLVDAPSLIQPTGVIIRPWENKYKWVSVKPNFEGLTVSFGTPFEEKVYDSIPGYVEARLH